MVILDGAQGADVTIISNRIAFSKHYISEIEIGAIDSLTGDELAGLVDGIGTTESSLDAAYQDLESDAGTPPVGAVFLPDAAGVTVVIMDRGIDWDHPDFINLDGSTRIKGILDMTGQNWCSEGNPLAVEYTEAQINEALAGGDPIAHRDAVGHGTATAGAAAGNGRALPDLRFASFAPEADLLIVKSHSEGAFAHDDEPAEAAFNGCMADALDWVDQKITELGQPAVGLWNAGVQWGPMDGTSALSREIEAVFGSDRPGRIWVASSGDEGSLPNHAGGEFNQTGTAVSYNKVVASDGFLTLWYSGDTPAQITLTLPTGTVLGPLEPGQVIEQDGVSMVHYTPGNEFYPWQSTSGDYAVWMRIQGNEGIGQFKITATGGSGYFDLYGDLEGGFLEPSIEFADHLVPGRLNDVSATLGAVVVGDHVLRDEYEDVNGITRVFTAEGSTGELWLKSSDGPTRDGRYPLDVTAAGEVSFASLASNSEWSTYSWNLPLEGQGYYVRFGGTSGAGPIVVGAIAAMLSVNPELTAAEVKQILRDTATSDKFTGVTPNEQWGYGKLDVVAAVQAAREQ